MTLRKLDFNTVKNFECDGRKFEVTDSLSFVRYKELQKISLEFGFSATFEDIFKNNQKAIDAYNKHDYFTMSIILYKIQEGIKTIEDKDDPSLRLCALFINEIGEDPTKYNDAMMKAKIDCWGRELDIAPFFYLAASLVPGWIPGYRLVIQDGLKPEEKVS
jgi:hypothetical protein